MNDANEDLRWRVRERLGEVLRAEARDALGFAVAVVLLTAVVLTAVLLLVAAAPLRPGPTTPWLGLPGIWALGASFTLFGMLTALLIGQPPDPRTRPMGPLIAATLIMAAIGALGLATPWVRSSPGTFWIAVGVLVVAALAMLGRVYEPRDDYYIGWVAGPFLVDNPFTFRDDIDRGHIALGFAAAIPAAIVSAYATIFGSGWLWRPLDPAQLDLAATLLIDAEREPGSVREERLLPLGHRRAAQVLRVLSKLELVRGSSRRVELTSDGRELMRQARGLRG